MVSGRILWLSQPTTMVYNMSIFNGLISTGLEDFTTAQKAAAVQLINVISDCAGEGKISKANSDKLISIFKKITGLTYEIEVEPILNAAMFRAPVFNMGGVDNLDTLNDNDFESKEYVGWILRYLKDTVIDQPFYYDNKTGLLGGKAVDKMVFKMIIGTELLFKLDPQEIVAVILHELGHSWIAMRNLLVFYDQSMLSITANVYCNTKGLDDKEKKDVVKEVLNRLDRTKHAKLYKKIEKGDYTKRDFLNACALINDDKIIVSGITTNSAMIRRNEQAADYFAASLGLGEALVTGLRKIGVKPITLADQTLALMRSLFALGATIGIAMMASPFFLVPMFVFIAEFVIDKYDTYDNDTARIARIRKTMIADLKRASSERYTKAEIKDLIDAIDRIGAQLEKARTHSNPLAFLNPFYVRRYVGRRQEERLEELMHSNLFVSAYRLNTLD